MRWRGLGTVAGLPREFFFVLEAIGNLREKGGRQRREYLVDQTGCGPLRMSARGFVEKSEEFYQKDVTEVKLMTRR